MSTDESAKKAILARRAKFVAAALAGVGIAACGKDPVQSNPQQCLKIATPIEHDAGAAPTPCLEVHEPRDAAPEPSVCLRAMPKPAGSK